MKVLAIIPTYNECRNIPVLIGRINAAVRGHALDILVVDDNSPDGTAECVRGLQQAHTNVSLRVRPGKLGLASASISNFIDVQRGALAARGYEAIVTMDADLSHPPEYLPAMLDTLQDYNFVNGSRYIRGGAIENWSLHRRVLSYLGNFYVRTLLRTGIRDMSSGFTAFRAEILQTVDLERVTATGYAFLSEIKYLFSRLNLRMGEVPITFTDRVNGDSKISQSIIRAGLLMPWVLLCRGVRGYIPPVMCRLCGGVAEFSFNMRGFNLFTCRDCRLIQVHPPVGNERLRRYYHTTCFKAHKTDTLSYTDYDKAMIFKRPLLATITAVIKTLNNVRDVLDVGSAYGDFVAHLTREGCHAEGVELSDHAGKVARSRGVNVHQSTAEEFARSVAAPQRSAHLARRARAFQRSGDNLRRIARPCARWRLCSYYYTDLQCVPAPLAALTLVSFHLAAAPPLFQRLHHPSSRQHTGLGRAHVPPVVEKILAGLLSAFLLCVVRHALA